MSEPSYEVKIPNIMNPFTVEVNGNTYSFPAGTTQEVNQEVYDVIRNIESMVPTPNPRAGEPSFESLRDKPFYSETVMGDTLIVGIDPKYLPKGGVGYEESAVLFDQRVEFADDGEPTQIPQLLPLSVGDSVKVTWNGVEYECVAFDSSAIGEAGSAAIGNLPNVTGVDTGEPFMVATVPVSGLTVVLSREEITEASVKIEKSVIHTIDPKFIPAGVGGGVVIVQDSAMASGVAVASQAPATATMNTAEIAEAIFAGKTVFFLDWNSGNLMPFTGGFRFADFVSGVMPIVSAPTPYALFSSVNEGGAAMGVKVLDDGSYETFEYGYEGA